MDKKEFIDLLIELETSYFKAELAESFKVSQQFEDAKLEWQTARNKLCQFFDSVTDNR